MSSFLFENNYLKAKLLAISDFQVLHCVWFDVWLSKEDKALEEALTFCYDFAKKQGIRILISDCSAISTVSLEVDAWIAQWWYPTCYQNGIIAEILIDSKDFMGQIAVNSFIEGNKSEVMNPKVKSLENAKTLALHILKQNPF
ncbi:MAG: hypothetical protein JJT94_16620 [Bernardetiaceae bacterium]|nr:hypothetical protein [Bernardetiaceae bacterium]